MGEMRNAYNILVQNLKGKKPLGGPRHRWEDNNKIGEISGSHGGEYEDHKETIYKGAD
jgi:hypothetical protein